MSKKNKKDKLDNILEILTKIYTENLITEQINDSVYPRYCAGYQELGNDYFLNPTKSEFNKIPKENGKLTYCKYKTLQGPIFISTEASKFELVNKKGSEYFKGNDKFVERLKEKYKDLKMSDETAKTLLDKNADNLLKMGSINAFTDENNVQYTISIGYYFAESGLDKPVVYFNSLSEDKFYESPDFSSSDTKTDYTFGELYKSWKNEEEQFKSLVTNENDQGWAKFVDQYGNPKEGVDPNSEEFFLATLAYNQVLTTFKEKNDTLKGQLIDQAVAVLPKYQYVMNNKVYNEPPSGWNLCGYYEQWNDVYFLNASDKLIEEPNTKQNVEIQRNTIADEICRSYLEKNKKDVRYLSIKSPTEIKNDFNSLITSENLPVRISSVQSNDSLINNEILTRLFSENAIKFALENCTDTSRYFLKEVAEGRYVDKTTGRIVGFYYLDNNGTPQLQRYTPNKSVDEKLEGIPCESATYDEYGFAINTLVSIVAGFIYPPLLAENSWRLFTALLLESVVNAYNLQESLKAPNNETRIQMDVAFLILPFLAETSVFKNILQRTSFTTTAQQGHASLLSRIAQLPKNNGKYEASVLKNFVESLTDAEKAFLQQIDDPKFKSLMSEMTKEMKRTLKSRTLVGGLRQQLPLVSYLLVYGIPGAAGGIVQYRDAMNRTLGNSMTEQQKEFIDILLTGLNERARKELSEKNELEIKKIVEKSVPTETEVAEEVLDKVTKAFCETFKNTDVRLETCNNLTLWDAAWKCICTSATGCPCINPKTKEITETPYIEDNVEKNQ
jgi:hypothetical protein